MAEQYPGQLDALRRMLDERLVNRAMAEARGFSPRLLDIFYDREIARYQAEIERLAEPPAAAAATPGTPKHIKERT